MIVTKYSSHYYFFSTHWILRRRKIKKLGTTTTTTKFFSLSKHFWYTVDSSSLRYYYYQVFLSLAVITFGSSFLRSLQKKLRYPAVPFYNLPKLREYLLKNIENRTSGFGDANSQMYFDWIPKQQAKEPRSDEVKKNKWGGRKGEKEPRLDEVKKKKWLINFAFCYDDDWIRYVNMTEIILSETVRNNMVWIIKGKMSQVSFNISTPPFRLCR